mgnify:CR=1 FL=1
MEKAKVYFTKTITPQKVVEMYELLGKKLPGKVAVKLHSGEEGNRNYLRPEFVKPMVEHVNGTVVECNTAYDGARNTTEKHLHLIHEHHWDEYFDFDLLDAEGPDLVLEVPNGKTLKNVVREIPLERIVTETDCPYLAPVPFRGKRNDSRMIRYVIQEIARLKGISEEEAEEALYQNALRVYKKVK